MVRRVFFILFSLAFIAPVNTVLKTPIIKPGGVPLPVIMYHSVCNINPGSYVISVGKFENDLRYLLKKGYTSILTNDVINYVSGDGALPEKPVIITLDDGFYNNLSLAYPLLKKYGFQAVISVVGKFTLKEESRKEVSNSFTNLSFEEIQQLKQLGDVEFGNHTYNLHSLNGRKGAGKLPGEGEAHYKSVFANDMEKNEKLFWEKCGLNFQIFTYPFGIYNTWSSQVLKSKGYKACYTCNEGINLLNKEKTDLYQLKRINRANSYTTERFMSKYGIL